MAESSSVQFPERQIENLTQALANNEFEHDQILRAIQKRFILNLIRRAQEQLDAKLLAIQQKIQK